MPGFGQVVLGPPGSGKTTYCAGLLQFFAAIGRYVFITAFLSLSYFPMQSTAAAHPPHLRD